MAIKYENKMIKVSGFTIVELLIVIVVIAILAALIAASYVGMNRKATIASLQSDLKNSSIKLAIDKTNNDSYPATKEAADNGKGLKASPNNTYEYTSNGSTYCLSETSGTLAYFLSSENGVPTPGVCPGHLLPVGYEDGGSGGGGGGGEEPITLGWKDVLSGGGGACAIAANNQIYCWGSNDGQIGDNTTAVRLLPTPTLQGGMPSQIVKAIAAGGSYNCAIASNDQVYCWGKNNFGQLGNNTTTDSLIPTPVSQGAMPSLSVKAISAEEDHACVIASDDHAYCWGVNMYGEVGDNTSSNYRMVPTAVMQGSMPSLIVKEISAGGDHTCVVADNDQIYCWGGGGYGQVGDSTTNYRLLPTAVLQGDRPSLLSKSITTGLNHTCAISVNNNQAYCWGQNYYGQIGDGNSATTNRLVPIAVSIGSMSNLAVKSISTKYNHTCAVGNDNKAYCWGLNSYGQAGDNTQINRFAPVAVLQGAMSSMFVESITAGLYNTCVIDLNNQVYCLGINYVGQVGDNTTIAKMNFVSVVNPF